MIPKKYLGNHKIESIERMERFCLIQTPKLWFVFPTMRVTTYINTTDYVVRTWNSKHYGSVMDIGWMKYRCGRYKRANYHTPKVLYFTTQTAAEKYVLTQTLREVI